MKNKSIGIIILARYSSSRLPGKALLEIEGKPLLGYVVERLRMFFESTNIILATSREKSDDIIEAFAKDKHLHVYRGSLDNVALRFYQAAKSMNVDYAIRVTGDSLFVDCNIINRMIDAVNNKDYDLISNRKYRLYPVGQSFDIVNVKRYRSYYDKFYNSSHYEHVTKYFFENEKETSINIFHHVNPDGDFGYYDLAIDSQDDFDSASKIINYAGVEKIISLNYQEIIELYKNLNI